MTNEFLYTSSGKNDECYTPAYGVEPLLEFLPQYKYKIIWCPFDTDDSEFCKVLRGNGYEVFNSHISNGQDYFNYEPRHWDIMISNPPFTGKKEIFKRALSFNKPFALLMTLTWLNDSAPMKLFKDKGLQLLMFTSRMEFKKQSPTPAPACGNELPTAIPATHGNELVLSSTCPPCSTQVGTVNSNTSLPLRKQINFSSAYYCRDFLPEQICIRDFGECGQRKIEFEDIRSIDMNTAEVLDLVPLSRFNDYFEFPSVEALRQLRFYNKNGFNEKVIRSVGKRLYVKISALKSWIEETNLT